MKKSFHCDNRWLCTNIEWTYKENQRNLPPEYPQYNDSMASVNINKKRLANNLETPTSQHPPPIWIPWKILPRSFKLKGSTKSSWPKVAPNAFYLGKTRENKKKNTLENKISPESSGISRSELNRSFKIWTKEIHPKTQLSLGFTCPSRLWGLVRVLKTQSLDHLWQSQELDHLDHAGDIKNYGNGECDQLAKNRLCGTQPFGRFG